MSSHRSQLSAGTPRSAVMKSAACRARARQSLEVVARDGDVADLAAGADLLAVDVHLDARVARHDVQVRRVEVLVGTPPRTFTMTDQRRGRRGSPSGRSSTARRCCSNWRGDGAVDGPVAGVVRPHRQLVDQDAPVVGLEHLHGEDADDVELAGDRERDLGGGDGEVAVQARGRGDDLPADRRRPARSGRRARRRAWPLGLRATRAASSRRNGTSSSASSPSPPAAGEPAVGVLQLADDEDPLAVVAAPRRLEHDGQPDLIGERGEIAAPHTTRQRGTGRPSAPSRCRMTTLSCAWIRADAPGRTATPADSSERRIAEGTCS